MLHIKLSYTWKTIPIICIILLTDVQLSRYKMIVGAQECHESTATVEVVSHCPKTLKEKAEAADRKACSRIRHSCISFDYHCVLNVVGDKTIEVCAPTRNIVGNVCAEFNDGGKSIQRHIRKKCKTCPAVYQSNDSYKYEECYNSIKLHVKQSRNATPVQDTTIQLNTESSLSSNSNSIIPQTLVTVIMFSTTCKLATMNN